MQLLGNFTEGCQLFLCEIVAWICCHDGMMPRQRASSKVRLKRPHRQTVPLPVLANALGALVVCLYMPTLMTAVYNQAKRSPCALRFHAAAEGGWDIGGASGCLAAAVLSAAGAPLSWGILLSLRGMALSLFLLRRHYAATAALPATREASVGA